MDVVFEVVIAIRAGWEALRRQPKELIAGFVVTLAVSIFSLMILAGPAWVAYSRFCLRAVRGERVELHELLDRSIPLLPTVALAAMVLLAIQAVQIFGSYLGGMLAFATLYLALWSTWFMADGEDSPVAALALSVRLNLARPAPTLVLYVVIYVIVASHPLLAILGSLVSAPVLAAAYRQFRE